MDALTDSTTTTPGATVGKKNRALKVDEMIGVHIPSKYRDAVKGLAKAAGKSESQWVRELIIASIDSELRDVLMKARILGVREVISVLGSLEMESDDE